jgi:hypothetical protein
MEILHTEGKEFITMSDKRAYKGNYFYHNNTPYSGTSLNDVLSEELLPVTFNDKGWKYIPIPCSNVPNNGHYLNDNFKRYFCRKPNRFEYIEINENIYNSIIDRDEDIDWESYEVISCDWKLTGNRSEVYNFNQTQLFILVNSNKWHGLNYFIQEGYLKYYLPI